MRALLFLAVLVTTPAVAADQFDLSCVGGKKGTDHAHYRIDLVRGEYCEADCGEVKKIQQITSGMITLYSQEPTTPSGTRAYKDINRVTGEWRWYDFEPRLDIVPMDIHGTCTPATFSGLPQAKF
jgi:hypothetical protein